MHEFRGILYFCGGLLAFILLDLLLFGGAGLTFLGKLLLRAVSWLAIWR